MIYLNENNPDAAQWLRDLIDADLIPRGVVDERSIEDVLPSDLDGFAQCHFFAGIGGWPLAVRLADWPDDRPVWTGSCPCQPFSAAGKGAGFADERHLWPAFFHLIEQRQPDVVFGEQVASPDGLRWLDLVCADLEGQGYAVGAVDTCAAGFGAAHLRQRLYWVADDDEGLAQRVGNGRVQRGALGAHARQAAVGSGDAHRVADTSRERPQEFGLHLQQRRPNTPCAEAHRRGTPDGADGHSQVGRPGEGRTDGRTRSRTNEQWSTEPRGCGGGGVDWTPCADGKWRPTEPGTLALAYGLPTGMARVPEGLRGVARVAGLDGAGLRRAKSFRVSTPAGLGNAIVPAQGAAFVRAYLTRE